MKKTALAVLLSVAAGGVVAEERGLFGMAPKENTFSYNYFDATVLHMDQNDMHGLRVDGSVSVVTNLSIIGSLSAATRGRHDYHGASIGAAYHQKLNGTSWQKTDFVLRAEVEFAEYKYDNRGGPDFEDDDVGVAISAGLRHALIDDLEVYGDFGVRTTFDTDLFVKLGARYSILPELQIIGGVEVSDNDIISAGVRYTF